MDETERVTCELTPLHCRKFYDYQICHGQRALRETLKFINLHGYEIVAVSQHYQDYTVFFRRALGGVEHEDP